MRIFATIWIGLSVIVAGCASLPSATTVEVLAEPFADMQEKRDAYAASGDGLPDTWPDKTPEANAARLTELMSLRSNISALSRNGLDEDETLNIQILETIVDSQISRASFDEARLPFTGDSGFHTEILFQISNTRLISYEDAEATIRLIEGIPDYLDQYKANMRRGLATGVVSYKDPLNTVLRALEKLEVESPALSPLYTPFMTKPPRLEQEKWDEIDRDARAAISDALGAFKDIHYFLTEEYAPHVRAEAGIVNHPQAKDYYRALVAFHTTLPDMTPEEVHQIGQAEVARIRSEMDKVIEESGFEGSFSEFLDFLRTDEQFYAKTPDELLMHAARMAKDIDYKMPAFFSVLPRLSYGVEPVPEAIAPGYTTGRYVSGDVSEGKAGIYWVNTYALDQRPLYELPALTAHEGVPGHHHQISVARELKDVPEFRRKYYATSFGEGWGLYSEALAEEMGLYKTPYEQFGRLSYEMWRACRLVADTGLHWYGWSREEAEVCFKENSALAPLNIETEVTRYIGWPGQALGYKIGELKIKELRARAEKALGEEFDIRAFHDVLLEKGALPLSVLEARVDAWILRNK